MGTTGDLFLVLDLLAWSNLGSESETVAEVRTDFILLFCYVYPCAVSKSKSWLILTVFGSHMDLF